MTLQDFRNELETILTESLPLHVVADEIGNTMPRHEYRATRLWLLAGQIRRCAWTASSHAEASRLAARAEQAQALLLGNPLPRPIYANRISSFPKDRREHVVFVPQPLPTMTDAERDEWVAWNVRCPEGWQVVSTIACRAKAGDWDAVHGWNIRVRFAPTVPTVR